jgi:hypothetical protein
MRYSDKPFGPVSQRAIIYRLLPHLGAAGLAVTFNNLLIRKDHDNWTRGKGDIYMKYELRSNAEEISGRWPSSGESKFDDNQSKTLNAYAGMITMPVPGSSAQIDVKVRDNDWPDGDDKLESDATVSLNPASAFEIDRSDYRLRGIASDASIRVLLDYIHIIHDQDGFCWSGDIKIKYTVSNGSQEVKGRWPSSGTANIGSGDSKQIGILAAAIPRPTAGNNLTIHLKVIDEDGFLCGGDDLVGENTFTFTSADNFGGNGAVHVREVGNYRITFSIVSL